ITWTAVASMPLTKDHFAHVVPGALKTYDLSDLARLIAPRTLVLLDVTDAAGEQVPLDRVRETWKSTGPRGALRVMDSRHPEPSRALWSAAACRRFVSVRRYRLASTTRLNGVFVAIRNLEKPLPVTTSSNAAGPA